MAAPLQRRRAAPAFACGGSARWPAWGAHRDGDGDPDGAAAEVLVATETAARAEDGGLRRRLAERVHMWTACGATRVADPANWQAGREGVRGLHRFVALGVNDPKKLVVHVDASAEWVTVCVGAVVDVAEKSKLNARGLAASLEVHFVLDEDSSAPARAAVPAALEILTRRYGMRAATLDLSTPERAAWRGAVRVPPAGQADEHRAGEVDHSPAYVGGLQISGPSPSSAARLQREGPWISARGLVRAEALLAQRPFAMAHHETFKLEPDATGASRQTTAILREWLAAIRSSDHDAILCFFEASGRNALLKEDPSSGARDNGAGPSLQLVLLRSPAELERLVAAQVRTWKQPKRRKLTSRAAALPNALPLLDDAWADGLRQAHEEREDLLRDRFAAAVAAQHSIDGSGVSAPSTSLSLEDYLDVLLQTRPSVDLANHAALRAPLPIPATDHVEPLSISAAARLICSTRCT